MQHDEVIWQVNLRGLRPFSTCIYRRRYHGHQIPDSAYINQQINILSEVDRWGLTCPPFPPASARPKLGSYHLGVP